MPWILRLVTDETPSLWYLQKRATAFLLVAKQNEFCKTFCSKFIFVFAVWRDTLFCAEVKLHQVHLYPTNWSFVGLNHPSGTFMFSVYVYVQHIHCSWRTSWVHSCPKICLSHGLHHPSGTSMSSVRLTSVFNILIVHGNTCTIHLCATNWSLIELHRYSGSVIYCMVCCTVEKVLVNTMKLVKNYSEYQTQVLHSLNSKIFF